MKMKKLLSALLATAIASSSLVFAGCGIDIKSDKVMVTIGSEKITMKDMKGFIAMSEMDAELFDAMILMQSQNGMGGMTGLDTNRSTWESDSSIKEFGDKTMDDYVEKYIVNQEAKKAGKDKIEDSEIKKFEENAEKLLDACSDKMKKNGDLKKEDFVEYQKMMYVYNKYKDVMMDEFKVEKKDVEKDYDYDNEYRQYKTTYYSIPYVIVDPQTGTSKTLSDKEKKEAKSNIDKVLERLDDKKSKEDIQKEFKDDGLQVQSKDFMQSEAYPDKVKKKDDDKKDEKKEDTKVDEYVEKARELKKGEHTGVFEYQGGYYIAVMDDNDSKESYNSTVDNAIQTKKTEMYNDKIKKFKESDDYKVEISDDWEKVDFGKLVIDRDEFDKAEGKITKKQKSSTSTGTEQQ